MLVLRRACGRTATTLRTVAPGHWLSLSAPMDEEPLLSDITTVYSEAIQSVAPPTLVAQALDFDPASGLLRIVSTGTEYRLDHNVKVVAFGKAVLGMLAALQRLLGNHIVEGVASVPVGAVEATLKRFPDHVPSRDRVRIFEGAADNLPDTAAHAAALAALSLVERAGEGELVVALISGGGSALLPCPVQGVSIQEKRQTVTALSRAGATIQELNTVRRSLSRTKGGRFAHAAHPAKVLALILSDVIGDPLEVIASGPTTPSPPSEQEALTIISQLNRLNFPVSVVQYLKMAASGKDGDNLCPPVIADSDRGASYAHVQNVIVGNNRIATAGAAKAASELGYRTRVWSHRVHGEARLLGQVYARIAHILAKNGKLAPGRAPERAPSGPAALQCLLEEEPFCSLLQQAPELREDLAVVLAEMQSLAPPLCLVGAGEPTVTVRGSGVGGRNQELALAFGIHAHKLAEETPLQELEENADTVFASVGTDGRDGPCDAAGAVVGRAMLRLADEQGLSADGALENNDSYTFFSELCGGKCLIRTGLTGTNVMDLHLLMLR